MNFKTEITDIYIVKDGYDCICSEMTINWELEFEARSWGIKSVYCSIQSIHGFYEQAKLTDDITDELDYEEIEFDYSGTGVVIWTEDVDIHFQECGSFVPDELTIDYDKLKIVVR